jgi:hypothetical protein
MTLPRCEQTNPFLCSDHVRIIHQRRRSCLNGPLKQTRGQASSTLRYAAPEIVQK